MSPRGPSAVAGAAAVAAVAAPRRRARQRAATAARSSGSYAQKVVAPADRCCAIRQASMASRPNELACISDSHTWQPAIGAASTGSLRVWLGCQVVCRPQQLATTQGFSKHASMQAHTRAHAARYHREMPSRGSAMQRSGSSQMLKRQPCVTARNAAAVQVVQVAVHVAVLAVVHAAAHVQTT